MKSEAIYMQHTKNPIHKKTPFIVFLFIFLVNSAQMTLSAPYLKEDIEK